MELNNDLITQFAKINKFNTSKSATTVRGKISKADDENARPYLVIDGAEEGSKTPVETVVEVSDGDRVIATVKDHSVIVTGNKTNPAIGKKTADGLRSEITQTASEIRAEVADDISGLNSTITQTANTINQRIENLNAVDGEEFTNFKQTVEGFYFTDEDGMVFIDGGKIYAKNLELTGAITWSDLSSTTIDTINSVADDAMNVANDAKNTAASAKAAADAVQLPAYIEDTYIDFSTVKSPYIIGGYMYAVGTDPSSNRSKSYTAMDENGFYLYHDKDLPDEDGTVQPKICLRTDADGNKVQCILGSGAADDSYTYNRFYIDKTSEYVSLYYVTNYYNNYAGINLFRHDDGKGEIQFHADYISGLFPIGYIYLSYNHTSPASLFGGTWVRLSPYFLYAAGSNATIGETGPVSVTGTAAQYIKISAWRRTA